MASAIAILTFDIHMIQCIYCVRDRVMSGSNNDSMAEMPSTEQTSVATK